jgi:hypothetical protein
MPWPGSGSAKTVLRGGALDSGILRRRKQRLLQYRRTPAFPTGRPGSRAIGCGRRPRGSSAPGMLHAILGDLHWVPLRRWKQAFARERATCIVLPRDYGYPTSMAL